MLHARHQRRQGTLYISVLGAALLLSMTALSAIHIARTELRGSTSRSHTTTARLAAEAGVAYALAETVFDSSWRQNHQAGVESAPFEWTTADATAGEFSYQFTAEDLTSGGGQTLTASDSDTFTVRGTGHVGDSVSVVEVTLINSGEAYTVLDTALSAEVSLNLNEDIELTASHRIFANGSVDEDDATVLADVVATGAIDVSGGGVRQPFASSLEFPNKDSVFDYYLEHGTTIDWPGGNSHTFQDFLLSPTSNPFGTETNPEGIYVIDCEGANIKLKNCRIVGTLVLLNNDTCCLKEVVVMEPAIKNFPVLMVENRCKLEFSSTDELRESDINRNLNPPPTPINGLGDQDMTDLYTSSITGLIYVSDNLRLDTQGSSRGRVKGVLISESMTIRDDFEVDYDPIYFESPPPGFRDQSTVQALPGSWRRGAND